MLREYEKPGEELTMSISRRRSRALSPVFLSLAALYAAFAPVPALAQDDGAATPAVAQARAQALLSSSLAGTVESLPIEEGRAFSKGDILARLDCAVQRAQAEAASADVQAAQAELTARKALQARGGIGKVQVALAEAQAAGARARLELAEAVVDKCEIKAPFDGRVVELSVNEFEYVQPASPLLSIVSTQRPEVEISAPSGWLRRVSVGSIGEVRFNELDRSFAIRITAIGATVDPVSATVKLKAAFEGDVDGILPGMSGLARFE